MRNFIAGTLGAVLFAIVILVGSLSIAGQPKEVQAASCPCVKCEGNVEYTCVVDGVACPDQKLPRYE